MFIELSWLGRPIIFEKNLKTSCEKYQLTEENREEWITSTSLNS
jgi:hypothetical protein